jgi:uncharacterized cupin superfamily protein
LTCTTTRFEESSYIVNGRVKAAADGQMYDLNAGDAIWAVDVFIVLKMSEVNQ